MSNAPKKSLPRPGRTPATQIIKATPASTSRQIALLAAQAGLEKKATGIEIIDVMGKVDYADYLVLMSGASDRNVAAIAQEVDGALDKAGFRSMSVEGLPAAQWVLIDFVDVVVHVFQKDARSLYDLDGLWMDAERVPVQGVTSEPDEDAFTGPVVVGATVRRTKAKVTAKRPTKKAKTSARLGASKAPGRKPAAGKVAPKASKAVRKAKTSSKKTAR